MTVFSGTLKLFISLFLFLFLFCFLYKNPVGSQRRYMTNMPCSQTHFLHLLGTQRGTLPSVFCSRSDHVTDLGSIGCKQRGLFASPACPSKPPAYNSFPNQTSSHVLWMVESHPGKSGLPYRWWNRATCTSEISALLYKREKLLSCYTTEISRFIRLPK